jgi:hypothetical protein
MAVRQASGDEVVTRLRSTTGGSVQGLREISAKRLQRRKSPDNILA